MEFKDLERVVSRQNAGLKEALNAVREERAKKAGKMLLEGMRLLSLALPSGGLQCLYFRDDAGGAACYKSLRTLPAFSAERARRLSPPLYAELSQTEQSQGVIGLFQAPEIKRLTTPFSPRSRLLILEEIQDPGNLGNLSRSVEAMGFQDLLFVGPHVRPWNAKSLRASMGSALYLRYYEAADLPTALPFLKELDLVTADMSGDKLSAFSPQNRERGFALLLGNEARGVSGEALRACRYLISIDMRGKAESFNLGNAASVLAWELSRLYGYFSD